MSLTYTATLPVREQTALFVSRLLHEERLRRGTRTGTRALGPYKQAVLVLRWFLDSTRVAQLAADNTIAKSTAYDYLHEGIDVLAARAPKLESALLAAKVAGHSHISIDGTLIETDRCRTPGPTKGVDQLSRGNGNNTEYPPARAMSNKRSTGIGPDNARRIHARSPYPFRKDHPRLPHRPHLPRRFRLPQTRPPHRRAGRRPDCATVSCARWSRRFSPIARVTSRRAPPRTR